MNWDLSFIGVVGAFVYGLVFGAGFWLSARVVKAN